MERRREDNEVNTNIGAVYFTNNRKMASKKQKAINHKTCHLYG